MTARTRSVAMLAANPAFGAILCRTLQDDGNCRVASFSSVETLTTFLRISPVDVVILDTELPGAPAIDIARGLRQHVKLASPDFAIVALTRAAEAFHKPLLAAGIDAVLTKPVVPPHLLDCIDGLLADERQAVAMHAHRGTDRQPQRTLEPHPVVQSGNVIPLFGRK